VDSPIHWLFNMYNSAWSFRSWELYLLSLIDCSGHVNSTWLAQSERPGHVSSICLAQFDCLGHVSSTVNITLSLSLSLSLSLLSRCPSSIVAIPLRVSHNVPRVLHGQVTWVVYPELHAPCTDKQCKETWPAPRAWYR